MAPRQRKSLVEVSEESDDGFPPQHSGTNSRPQKRGTSSVAGKKRKAEELAETPRSKRKARPSNITVSPHTTNKIARRGGDVDANQSTASTLSTSSRYLTRSRQRRQDQLNNASAQTTPQPSPNDQADTAQNNIQPTPTHQTIITPSNPPPVPTQQNVVVPTRPAPRKPFNLFDRICGEPDVILRVASLIPVANLLDLYAMSKPFHFIMNSHHTSYICASARIHAPDSSYIFPWRCYRRLTIKDPGYRLNNRQACRDVPSLLWLQMVAERHRACTKIWECMNEAGFSFPGKEVHTVRALKKMWFLMDLPSSAVRIGTVHNSNHFSDQDVFCATFFLLRLDMRLTDPVEGTGEVAMRKMLMGQRSMYPLRNMLEGKLRKIDLITMYIRYDYNPMPNEAHMECLGVTPELQGRGCLEGWGVLNTRLIRPDELLLREQKRRNMNLHLRYLEMIRFGFKMQWNHLPRNHDNKLTLRDSTKSMDELVKRSKEVGKERERLELKAWNRQIQDAVDKANFPEKVKAKQEKMSVWMFGKKK